jgi:hypothetical protein
VSSLRTRLSVVLAAALLAGALAVALFAGGPAPSRGGTGEGVHFAGIARGPLGEATHSAEAAENRRLARARARGLDEAALRREREAR